MEPEPGWADAASQSRVGGLHAPHRWPWAGNLRSDGQGPRTARNRGKMSKIWGCNVAVDASCTWCQGSVGTRTRRSPAVTICSASWHAGLRVWETAILPLPTVKRVCLPAGLPACLTIISGRRLFQLSNRYFCLACGGGRTRGELYQDRVSAATCLPRWLSGQVGAQPFSRTLRW